jgi:hypothetical protein
VAEANKGTGDELWDEFVREFEKSKGIHEPSADERRPAAKRPRRGKVMAAIATLAVVAALAGAGVWLSAQHEATGHVSAAPSVQPTATAGSSAAPSATQPMVTADQAFPAHVEGFTKVKVSGGPNCTGSGMVGPNLTALIDQSKGCRGVIGALYKDAANNQYTIVMFGMKDPRDVAHLIASLGSHPMDYEVGVLLPPAGSGLRSLPEDSGLVQSFAGTNTLLVVGLAQWSDGRTKDFQALTDKLQPLVRAVTQVASAHDHA